MSSFLTVFRNSGYLVGFKILSRILSVVFLIYAASHLGPELFGALSFVLVTVELLNSLGDLGITRYGARELVRYWDNKEVWAGKIMAIQVLTSVPFVVVATALVFYYHPSYPKLQLLLIGIAAFFLFSLISTTESVFTASQKFFYSAFFTFIGRFTYLVIGISVLAAGGSVVLVMWAYLIGVIVEVSLRLLLVSSKITGFSFHFPVKDLWRMLVATFPFALVAISVVFGYRINLMILEFFKGDVATGIFNIAFTLYMPFTFIAIILSTTTFPIFVELCRKDKVTGKKVLWQWYRLFALTGIPAAVAVTLAADSVLKILPASYHGSSTMLIILVWSVPFMLFIRLDLNILQAIDKMRAVVNGTVLGAIVTTAFSFILIPFYGGVGAAIAAVIPYVIQAFYYQWVVNKRFTHQFAFPLLLRPVLGGLAMAALGLILFSLNVWLAVATGFLAYLAVILATGALRMSEIKAMARG